MSSMICVEGSFDGNRTVDQTDVIVEELTPDQEHEIIEIESFNVSLKSDQTVFNVGDTIYYKITFNPTDTYYKTLTYSVNNPELVEVNTMTNYIRCLKNGYVEITFLNDHNPSLTSTVSFTIQTLQITSIKLSESHSDIFLGKGDTYKLSEPTILPEEAKDFKYHYRSDDNTVANVNENGLITGMNDGTCKIYIEADEGGAYDFVYVTVNGLNSFTFEQSEFSMYPDGEETLIVNLLPNDFYKFNLNYVKFTSNDPSLRVNFVEANNTNFTLTYKITYSNTTYIGGKDVNVTMSYVYPGGTNKVSNNFIVHILKYDSITVADVDTTKTKLNPSFTVYTKGGRYIKKTYYHTIYYISSVQSNIKKYNTKNFKFAADSNLNLTNSTYSRIQISIKNYDILKPSYDIKFYPNKDVDEFITFTVNFNVVEDTTGITNITFTNLYTTDENKENKIWYSKINNTLFSGVTFNNSSSSLYANSGIVVELDNDSKDLVDLVVNANGNVTKFNLLKFKNDTDVAEECIIKMNVYSKFDYETSSNPLKKQIIIKVVSSVTGFTMSLNNGEYNDVMYQTLDIDNKDITYSIYARYTYDLSSKSSSFGSGNYNKGLLITSTDETICRPLLNNNGFTSYLVGNCDIIVSLMPGYQDELFARVIHCNVQYESVSSDDLSISYDVVSFPEGFNPAEDLSYFAVGTILKFTIDGTEEAKGRGLQIVSNNSKLLSINQETLEGKCLKEGEATVTVRLKDNYSIRKEVTFKIYNTTSKLAVYKGEFLKRVVEPDYYALTTLINKSYQLSFAKEKTCTEQKISVVKVANPADKAAFDLFQVDENGNIETGEKECTGLIMLYVGSEENPYRQETKVYIIIKAKFHLDYSNFSYLIRKLVGHYGLFFGTSLLCMMFIFLTFDSIVASSIGTVLNIGAGFGLAYFSEYLQGFSASRTFARSDIMLDFYGYLTAAALVFIIILVFFFIRKYKEKHPKTLQN